MTKIEKVILVVLITGVLMFSGSMWYLVHTAKEAGGFKELIIEVGKEIKDIGREINKN